jgi:hypothetical protein
MGLFIWLFIDNLLRNERCIVLGWPIQQGTCRTQAVEAFLEKPGVRVGF